MVGLSDVEARHPQGVAAVRVAVGTVGLLAVALAPNVLAGRHRAVSSSAALTGSMDVAMNANAVVVEQQLSRAVMSSSHGFWSLGGFAGGGLGGIVIQNFGHLPHALLVTALALPWSRLRCRYLVAEDARWRTSTPNLRCRARRLVYLVGLMALFSMIPEGAVLDWAALYLRQELGTDLATAGFAFAGFSGAMAIMRFLGDGVRNRFGAVTTLRYSSLIAAAGMCIGGLSPWPWLAIAAFTFCGFGVANMVPIAFSAGGNQPGMSSGTGMSVVTTMGYSGILMAPSAIGFVAERTGFGPIFIALSALQVVVFLMAGPGAAADFAPRSVPPA